MALPANTTAISFANINTELGAVGNSTVSAANMPRSLNDDGIRRLAPGPGKTISTTSGTAISMDNLSSAYLREYMAVITNANYEIGAAACDAFGNIYAIMTIVTSLGATYLIKYNPQSNVVLWGRTITFNNSRGGSYISLAGGGGNAIKVENSGDVIVRLNVYYTAKYTFFAPLIISVSSNGDLLWQNSDCNAGSVISGSAPMRSDIACYNSDSVIAHLGDITTTTGRINFINASSGASLANTTYGITNYTSPLLYGIGSKPHQSNVYVVGYATNTNVFGVISQIDANRNITWTRRINVSNTYITDVTVGSDGSPYFISWQTGLSTSIFVVKVNTSGTLQWSRQITYPANVSGTGILTNDASDNLYMVILGASNTTANGWHFVSSLNSSGGSRWHRRITTATTANTFVTSGAMGRPSITGNRLIVPILHTSSNGAFWYANTGGPTTGSFGGFSITTITPTVGSTNATNYTTLTALTGTLTGANSVIMPNVSLASTTTNILSIINIT